MDNASEPFSGPIDLSRGRVLSDDEVFQEITIVGGDKDIIEDPNDFANLGIEELKHGFLIPHRMTVKIRMSLDNWVHYEIFRFLGGGSFGEVYEARVLNSNFANSTGRVDSGQSVGRVGSSRSGSFSRNVAIKFLKRMQQDHEIRVISEIPSLAFQSPNLVVYRAYHPGTRAFGSVGRCRYHGNIGILMMDVCQVGAAIDWLVRENTVANPRRQHFTPPVARRAIRDVILGLSHLRRFGVCHRDLKNDNIFINSEGVFVIGDLGHAKVVKPQGNSAIHQQASAAAVASGVSSSSSIDMIGNHTVKNIGGSYSAPELRENKYDMSTYDAEKVDVWGVGTILFTLLGTVNIWGLKGMRKTLDTDPSIVGCPENLRFWKIWEGIQRRSSAEVPGVFTSDCRMFLNRLLSYHSKNRPTLLELERAIHGQNDDPTLAWLTKEVCTIDELELELNGRSPNSVKFSRRVGSNSSGCSSGSSSSSRARKHWNQASCVVSAAFSWPSSSASASTSVSSSVREEESGPKKRRIDQGESDRAGLAECSANDTDSAPGSAEQSSGQDALIQEAAYPTEDGKVADKDDEADAINYGEEEYDSDGDMDGTGLHPDTEISGFNPVVRPIISWSVSSSVEDAHDTFVQAVSRLLDSFRELDDHQEEEAGHNDEKKESSENYRIVSIRTEDKTRVVQVTLLNTLGVELLRFSASFSSNISNESSSSSPPSASSNSSLLLSAGREGYSPVSTIVKVHRLFGDLFNIKSVLDEAFSLDCAISVSEWTYLGVREPSLMHR